MLAVPGCQGPMPPKTIDYGRVAHKLPSLLDGVHEAVKVRRERLETCGIQEETTLRGGMRRGARGSAALLREGNLLVLAEKLDFRLR